MRDFEDYKMDLNVYNFLLLEKLLVYSFIINWFCKTHIQINMACFSNC